MRTSASAVRDLLINVTRFFRDAELFETLRTKAIEPLTRNRDPDEDIRIWVPGCSSGEEAYSIAMLFAEAARETGQPLAVQIFATDIDEQMLQIAREGSYPASALADIPAPLRERLHHAACRAVHHHRVDPRHDPLFPTTAWSRTRPFRGSTWCRAGTC